MYNIDFHFSRSDNNDREIAWNQIQKYSCTFSPVIGDLDREYVEHAFEMPPHIEVWATYFNNEKYEQVVTKRKIITSIFRKRRYKL